MAVVRMLSASVVQYLMVDGTTLWYAGIERVRIDDAPATVSKSADAIFVDRMDAEFSIHSPEDLDVYYHDMLSRMGWPENCDEVRDLYVQKRRDAAADAVSQDLLDSLVIAGDPAFCRTRLGEWRQAGVGLPILGLPTDMGPEICSMYLQIMAPAA